MFGENRLIELLRARHPCQANEFKDAIFTKLSRFTSETTLRDDVALLVVARK